MNKASLANVLSLTTHQPQNKTKLAYTVAKLNAIQTPRIARPVARR